MLHNSSIITEKQSTRSKRVAGNYVRLIALSSTIKEAAAVVGINYDYARAIVKSYNQQGETAIHLKKQPPKKRPSHALLNTEQLEELRLSLKGESPDRGIWSGPKVALWIAQKIGRKQVGKQRGWEYSHFK